MSTRESDTRTAQIYIEHTTGTVLLFWTRARRVLYKSTPLFGSPIYPLLTGKVVLSGRTRHDVSKIFNERVRWEIRNQTVGKITPISSLEYTSTDAEIVDTLKFVLRKLIGRFLLFETVFKNHYFIRRGRWYLIFVYGWPSSSRRTDCFILLVLMARCTIHVYEIDIISHNYQSNAHIVLVVEKLNRVIMFSIFRPIFDYPRSCRFRFCRIKNRPGMAYKRTFIGKPWSRPGRVYRPSRVDSECGWDT